MAYVPKDWVTGEVITEQALDHIEQGIANAGVFFIHVNDGLDGTTLDKNFTEIKAAIDNGMLPIAVFDTSEGDSIYISCYFVRSLTHDLETPTVYRVDLLEYETDESISGRFEANSPTGVLTYTTGGGDIG